MRLPTRSLVMIVLLATLTACLVTEPVWEKPPEDAAIQSPPAYGHYFVEDRSIWASASQLFRT